MNEFARILLDSNPLLVTADTVRSRSKPDTRGNASKHKSDETEK